MTQAQIIKYVIKPALFVLCLAPFAILLKNVAADNLGANPIEAINRYTGDWTLRFLLLTLTITPLRRLSGWSMPMRFRRMLGLFAFFYVCMHFLSFAWLDQSFRMEEIIKDVIKRPYITLGFTSFLLLIPLAATSTDAMVRRLGARRWQILHRLVYVAAIGGVAHFIWMVKSDYSEPLIYAALLSVLLGLRVFWLVRATRNRFVRSTASF